MCMKISSDNNVDYMLLYRVMDLSLTLYLDRIVVDDIFARAIA